MFLPIIIAPVLATRDCVTSQVGVVSKDHSIMILSSPKLERFLQVVIEISAPLTLKFSMGGPCLNGAE